MHFGIWSDWISMDYFDYSYKHNYIEFAVTYIELAHIIITGMVRRRFLFY